MTDDAQLLRQFVESRSQPAFAEIVQRHLALVYHTAARQLEGDSHLAQDVAQSVFTLLAEKSRSLAGHPSIAGWLHTTTHFKVAELRRTEHRRRLREDAAQAMNELANDPASAAEWERLRPVIDEALLELNAGDREIVLLRFFENRPFAEIAARLRLSENTAHKRVERALEKLRTRLRQRGLTSSAVALAALLGNQASLAAPAGLASGVTAAVVSSGLPAAVALGSLSFMSTKTTLAAAAIAVLLASSALTYYEVNTNREAAEALAAATRENDLLVARLRAEQARLTQAVRTVATPSPPVVSAPAARPPAPAPETSFPAVEEGRALLRANPAFRAAFAANQRVKIAAQYADLLATLGLTEAELDRFLTIQANGRITIVGQHQLTLYDGPGEMINGEEYTRQLRELLGDARYQQYREFGRLGPARDLANQLTRSLYSTPTPLTPAQVDQMKQLVVQTIADPANGPRYTSGPSAYIPLPVWDALLARAPGVLAEPQLAALRDLQQQSKFMHAQTEARRAYDNPPAK